ncbi:MAG: hypothetical protein OEZ06_03490 [Myxococcales bacterium]|nr:hypothetical protein [Myxococcales bacterium]
MAGHRASTWLLLWCAISAGLGCAADRSASGDMVDDQAAASAQPKGGDGCASEAPCPPPAPPCDSGSGDCDRTAELDAGAHGSTDASPEATPADAAADSGASTTTQPGIRPDPTSLPSLIWIANTIEGTVSKLDTRTMSELGRYLTSPQGLGLPSRTSVANDGDAAIANRGNATALSGGDGGGVIKIHASLERCVDKNGNGAIETSTGSSDVLPWGDDECVAWYRPLGYFSNRPLAWAPAPAPDTPSKVWTAGTDYCDFAACSLEVLRLDGTTGAVVDSISIRGLAGVDFTTGASEPTVPPALLPPTTLIRRHEQRRRQGHRLAGRSRQRRHPKIHGPQQSLLLQRHDRGRPDGRRLPGTSPTLIRRRALDRAAGCGAHGSRLPAGGVEVLYRSLLEIPRLTHQPE